MSTNGTRGAQRNMKPSESYRHVSATTCDIGCIYSANFHNGMRRAVGNTLLNNRTTKLRGHCSTRLPILLLYKLIQSISNLEGSPRNHLVGTMLTCLTSILLVETTHPIVFFHTKVDTRTPSTPPRSWPLHCQSQGTALICTADISSEPTVSWPHMTNI